jgi:hypothetical protein
LTSTLSVIFSNHPGPAEIALAKLAEFSGIRAEFVDFKALFAASPDILHLILTAQTLADIDSSAMLPAFKRVVMQQASHLLVTAVSPSAPQSQTIRTFTDERVVSARTALGKMRPYVVSKHFHPITGPLTGLSLTPVHETDCVFQTAEGNNNVDQIISIGGMGHFIKTRMGNCDTYLLGSAEPLDIDTPVSESPWIKGCFSSLFPALMFMRQAFGSYCWHRTRNQATLTIDDPLLIDRYGFVHYQELLQLMDRYNFFTTIAFIPWNFRRTSPSVARLLHARRDRISICIHGCDHTRHELASPDHAELNGRIKLATIRMTEHQRLTGVPFDRVMVFPQGAFSSSCMEVLKANNYLAAVNLETTPVHDFDEVPLRHYLAPAITCFGNFPLFERQYPENVSDLALNLFLYKPALIIEHHNFFKKQSADAIQSIKRVNSLDPNLRWRGLEEVLARSYLEKQERNGLFSVRAFTRKTRLSNESDTKKEYIFSKEERDAASIEKVTVDGKKWFYDHTAPVLSFPLVIDAGATAEIEIVYRDHYPNTQVEDSFYRNLKIFSRRHLSEIRDNYLSHSPAALAIANRMKRLLV